jgi:hypothetical protein
MTTQITQTANTLTAVQQINLIQGAVQAVLENFSEVETAKEEVKEIEGGQLGILKNALKGFTQPVTEDDWDAMFRANVRTMLEDAKTDRGYPRYAKGSRDVMVNMFKVATIGLTLASHDRRFEPSYQSSGNLKKYYTEVRPKLQAATDPTGKPLLKTIASEPREPRNLFSTDSHYWLIGQTASSADLLLKSQTFGDLTRKVAEWRPEGKFDGFFYLTAKMTPMPEETAPEVAPTEEHEIFIKTVDLTSETATAPVA